MSTRRGRVTMLDQKLLDAARNGNLRRVEAGAAEGRECGGHR